MRCLAPHGKQDAKGDRRDTSRDIHDPDDVPPDTDAASGC
jgi:hypothetical protein